MQDRMLVRILDLSQKPCSLVLTVSWANHRTLWAYIFLSEMDNNRAVPAQRAHGKGFSMVKGMYKQHVLAPTHVGQLLNY